MNVTYTVDTSRIQSDTAAVPSIVRELSCLNPAEFRVRVLALEDACRDLPQIETVLRHHFAPGLYVREAVLPAGSLVIGKIHRHQHFVQLVSGTATIVTEHGAQTYTGPALWTSEPGAKRVVFSHTETTFLTFHPSDETDLDKLEDTIIAPSYEALEFDYGVGSGRDWRERGAGSRDADLLGTEGCEGAEERDRCADGAVAAGTGDAASTG